VVQVVVADTFDSIVNDPREDVFLELYDPRSPRCQELDPVLEDLAEQVGVHQSYKTLLSKRNFPQKQPFQEDRCKCSHIGLAVIYNCKSILYHLCKYYRRIMRVK